MSEKPFRHVVFNMSAAGSRRHALALPNDVTRILDDGPVIGCPDDLSFGPINPPDPAMRIAWMNREMGYWGVQEEDEYWESRMAAFWHAAFDPEIHPVVWVCRTCSQEYAGFLEFVHGRGDGPYDVVDVTGLTGSSKRRDGTTSQWQIQGFGEMPTKAIAERALWDCRKALPSVERTAHQLLWEKLRNENAPLRIIEDGKLCSAPITYFDEFILSCVAEEWQKSARIVGEALGRQADQPYRQTGDGLLWGRLRALAEAGRVEYRGDLSAMRTSEMRQRGAGGSQTS